MNTDNTKNLPVFFKYRILWHIIFWIAVYLAYMVSYGGYGGGKYGYEALINLILLPVRIVFTYAMIYFVIPRYLLTYRYKWFILATLIHAFLFGTILWFHFYFLLNFKEYWCCYNKYPLIYLPKILVQIIINYGIPLFAVIIKLFKYWYLDQVYKSQLEKEKLSSELKYLKSQIHPHFLFNTLNNLYALTLTKSEKASDIVIKLSNLLDYMLYNSNTDRITLNKEIDIVKSYIELEKIRYSDRLDLKLNIIGDTNSVNVAPLILFPFIENAFKHGASNDSKQPYINISIQMKDNVLILNVANSIPAVKKETSNGEGIGLNNIRRRLELIYPDQHELSFAESEDKFEVMLKLNL
jgi:two-component system, LytTR family, sensor kinase